MLRLITVRDGHQEIRRTGKEFSASIEDAQAQLGHA
jgi:hypothetical protein